jgi:hypothetical protein
MTGTHAGTRAKSIAKRPRAPTLGGSHEDERLVPAGWPCAGRDSCGGQVGLSVTGSMRGEIRRPSGRSYGFSISSLPVAVSSLRPNRALRRPYQISSPLSPTSGCSEAVGRLLRLIPACDGIVTGIQIKAPVRDIAENHQKP